MAVQWHGPWDRGLEGQNFYPDGKEIVTVREKKVLLVYYEKD
jgi:hypothetical protein